jgi:hypothetical protein
VGLKASNTGGYDEFGSSAPVSGDMVVVAGRFQDMKGTADGIKKER